MTRTEINAIRKQATQDGWTIAGTRTYGKNDYSLDVVDPRTGNTQTFHRTEQYNEWRAYWEASANA